MAILDAVLLHLDAYSAELQGSPLALGLSTQMHGFLITDEWNDPVTGFVSWQDERGYRIPQSPVVADMSRFVSGVAPKPGLPSTNLSAALDATPRHRRGTRFHTLGSFIASRLSTSTYATHVSNAASTGLMDLRSRKWNSELIEKLGAGRLQFPHIVGKFRPVGRVRDTILDEAVLYPDLGDHQATILGANPRDHDVVLSFGTAGIAARIASELDLSERHETRPFVDTGYLYAVSRLPGGRYSDALRELLRSAATMFGVIESDETLSAMMVGLLQARDSKTGISIHPSGGHGLTISGVMPDNLRLESLFDAFRETYVAQYCQAIDRLFHNSGPPTAILLVGGAALTISAWLAAPLSERFGCEVTVIDSPDLALRGVGILMGAEE